MQVLPQIAARARIESGGGLVEQQHRRMMQQSLGQFEPPLHASGKRLRFFLGAVGETDAAQHFADALLERGAAQAVKMADMRQVLFGRQLDVDALLLEDNADAAAHHGRLARHIVVHDQGASARGHHQGRENAEGRSLAAAVRAEQPEDLGRSHLERNPSQRDAVSVLVAELLELDDRCRRVAGVCRDRMIDSFRSCHGGSHRRLYYAGKKRREVRAAGGVEGSAILVSSTLSFRSSS